MLITKILLASYVILCSSAFAKSYKVGILQTASHPSLDAARQGFEKKLQEKLKSENIQFIVKNGEGQISQLQTIAKSFKSNTTLDAVYVIATPALQVMMKEEKIRPIVFTAVTSPESIGANSATASNVIGVTDKVDESMQVELIQQITPVVKKVGILFNPSEQNSASMVKDAKIEFAKKGLSVVELGIHNTSDIVPSLNSAAKKVDLVLIPTDNTAASAMPLIAKKAKQLKLPLMVSYVTSLDEGIFLETGVDYVKCGEEAAELLFQVLEGGKKTGEIGIRSPDGIKTVVHLKAMGEMKLELPKDVMKKAEKIPF